MPATIGDDLPDSGQKRNRFLQIGFRNAPRAWNVVIPKSFGTACIEKDKIVRCGAFNLLEHVIALFLHEVCERSSLGLREFHQPRMPGELPKEMEKLVNDYTGTAVDVWSARNSRADELRGMQFAGSGVFRAAESSQSNRSCEYSRQNGGAEKKEDCSI